MSTCLVFGTGPIDATDDYKGDFNARSNLNGLAAIIAPCGNLVTNAPVASFTMLVVWGGRMGVSW